MRAQDEKIIRWYESDVGAMSTRKGRQSWRTLLIVIRTATRTTRILFHFFEILAVS